MRSCVRINLDYIKAINSCDIETFHNFMTNLLVENETEERVRKLFSSKKYLWNILRGKDFYKMMSMYIVKIMGFESSREEGSALYDYVIETTKSEEVKKSFTKSIMKSTPFLTMTSIQYMSEQRLIQIINDFDFVYVDSYLTPFTDQIDTLRSVFM